MGDMADYYRDDGLAEALLGDEYVDNGAPFWTTKYGERIAIEEMSDRHLLNSIAMLERKGYISSRVLRFYLSGPEPSGDGAMMAYEEEQRDVFLRKVHPALDALDGEAKRRGLK